MKQFINLTFSGTIGFSLLFFVGYSCLFAQNSDKINTRNLICTPDSEIPNGISIKPLSVLGTKYIISKDDRFVDDLGRVMILHGINLGGSSKVPYTPRLASHIKADFYESAYSVSFVGRPFPLSESDEHFKRLQKWGYRFIRLVITWEAIEHEGPGIYDYEYLSYLKAIVQKAAEYDINVFIDPHQDVWSRFTGGDGAPIWTLEKVGFDPQNFSQTGAAYIHNMEGSPYPRMLWPTNYSKLGSATMFTLFFGGNDFAPSVKVDGMSAQEFLQSHYINAIKQVALTLKGMPNVIGFDTFNEPGSGYIEIADLNSYGILINGVMPTYFQGMVAGAGNPVVTGRFQFRLLGSKETEKVILNPNKVSAWKNPENDIWLRNGVWGYDSSGKPVILKPDYFSEFRGKKVDFSEDYFKPFILRFQDTILAVDKNWLIFSEPALYQEFSKFKPEESESLVNASHWYDVVTLLTKKYYPRFSADTRTMKPVIGKRSVRNTFVSQMSEKKKYTYESMGNRPTLVGEFGIPFDLNDKKSFSTLNFNDQNSVLDRSFKAMESNLLSYTLWNYTADNDNENGDQWNGEDLSIFSTSQRNKPNDIYSGGRALDAAIRPYPYKVAGFPLEYYFNPYKVEFYLKFNPDTEIIAPTEIFVPEYHYGNGYEVLHTPGKLAFDVENSLLLFTPDNNQVQIIIIKKK
jgi:hypothetical protein